MEDFMSYMTISIVLQFSLIIPMIVTLAILTLCAGEQYDTGPTWIEIGPCTGGNPSMHLEIDNLVSSTLEIVVI